MSKEQAKMFLMFVYQQDLRLRFCSLTETKENEWKHLEGKCPKCLAEYVLNQP